MSDTKQLGRLTERAPMTSAPRAGVIPGAAAPPVSPAAAPNTAAPGAAAGLVRTEMEAVALLKRLSPGAVVCSAGQWPPPISRAAPTAIAIGNGVAWLFRMSGGRPVELLAEQSWQTPDEPYDLDLFALLTLAGRGALLSALTRSERLAYAVSYGRHCGISAATAMDRFYLWQSVWRNRQ